MKKLRRLIPALTAAGLLAAAAAAYAAPVSINISAASVTGGVGYGSDDGNKPENGGNLLDVAFTGAFSAQELLFTQVGDRFTFDLVRVNFRETDAGDGGNAGIRGQEVNDLGVLTAFTFANPADTVVGPTGVGTATTGLIDDANVDYVLAWDPVVIDFGSGGKFQLSISTLSFSGAGTQTARAELEMLAAPETRVTAVPEPASLALVSLALAAAGIARRRRSA